MKKWEEIADDRSASGNSTSSAEIQNGAKTSTKQSDL